VTDLIWLSFAVGLTIIGLIYVRVLGDGNEERGS
jgi:hypothetical protein